MAESRNRLDLEAPPEAAGERLDRWLSRQLPEVSRSHLARLIEGGVVRLDGRAARPAARLKGGERITGTIEANSASPHPSTPLQAEPIPLPIVYANDDVLVVDKPAELVVHPAPGHASGTLVNAVLFKPIAVPGGERLVVINQTRLSERNQNNTSGVAYADFRVAERLADQLLAGHAQAG